MYFDVLVPGPIAYYLLNIKVVNGYCLKHCCIAIVIKMNPLIISILSLTN